MREISGPNERKQLCELRLGLAGQAGDEGRANRHPGNFVQALQQSLDIHSPVAAVHASQQAVIDVLQRQVNVLTTWSFAANSSSMSGVKCAGWV